MINFLFSTVFLLRFSHYSTDLIIFFINVGYLPLLFYYSTQVSNNDSKFQGSLKDSVCMLLCHYTWVSSEICK